jgi:glycogen synthase kinase 3 beta
MAEMLLGRPMFAGENGVEQLVEIVRVLGTPTREQIARMNPSFDEFKFPDVTSRSIHDIFEASASPEAVDLLTKMIVYVPSERITAIEALAHPFFDELRDSRTRLPNGRKLPRLFDFTDDELRGHEHLRPALIPTWYKDAGTSSMSSSSGSISTVGVAGGGRADVAAPGAATTTVAAATTSK